LRVHLPDGSTFLREMTSWPVTAILKVWRKSKVQVRQSMRIYVKNIAAKFHPNPIWNDGALGCLWRESPQQEEEQQQDE